MYVCNILRSMFYSVQVLYTTNQQTSVFKDSLDTKYKIFKNRLNSYFLCFMFKIEVYSLKVVKLTPCIKTYRKNVACRVGSTIGLRSPPCERRYSSLCSLWESRSYVIFCLNWQPSKLRLGLNNQQSTQNLIFRSLYLRSCLIFNFQTLTIFDLAEFVVCNIKSLQNPVTKI